MLGKIEGRRRRGLQRMRWLERYHQFSGHELGQTPGDGGGKEARHAAVHGVVNSDRYLNCLGTLNSLCLSSRILFKDIFLSELLGDSILIL